MTSRLHAPSVLLGLTLTCSAVSCVAQVPQSKAAPSCRAQCQAAHDKCVLGARTEPAVHGCNNDETWCVNHCAS